MTLRQTLRPLTCSVAVVAISFMPGQLAATGANAQVVDSEKSAFSDVDPGRFDSAPIAWAREASVVTGVTAHCFVPDRAATRGEVAVVLHRAAGSPSPFDAPHPFTDVTALWQQDAVAWLFDGGHTTGVAPTTFAPDRAATRAEVAALLWRMSGRPAATPELPFVDVTTGWQVEAVAWMTEAGHTTGRSADRFEPDAAVSRGELVTFVWRWMGRPSPPRPAPPTPRNCLVDTKTCAPVFTPAIASALAAAHPHQHFTAHVRDHRTGCTYDLNPGLELTTASVVKAQILAAVLLRSLDTDRPLTSDDHSRLDRMIRFSHNRPPTSELYAHLGGAEAMEAADARFGLTNTSHTAWYGATTSTAADRTSLVEQLLVAAGPLDAASRSVAWDYMSTVAIHQRWGLTAGLPAGYDHALKNGFYPMSGRGWRAGTTGVVRDPDAGTYALTVLTENNSTESAGIALVERITTIVNSALTVGAPVARPVDTANCIDVEAGSWADAATVLGIGSDEQDIALLRHHNGGEQATLSGQRVCAPHDVTDRDPGAAFSSGEDPPGVAGR